MRAAVVRRLESDVAERAGGSASRASVRRAVLRRLSLQSTAEPDDGGVRVVQLFRL